ncbi:MAG: hypothetical protein JWL98_1445 [Xanthomonadaceae bacterium]|nr:hypothetical protein [Xanthomonadaceae bacterium]
MNNTVEGLLQQLANKGNEPVSPQAQEQFHQIAQSTPPEVLSQGLTEAFNSEQTPPFAQMVGHLFGRADNQQKSGIISALLGSLGAGAHPALAQAGINASPDQATQLSTAQVQQIATQAQQANPGVVAQMSNFYAQHPVLVKSLGAAAMAIVLGRMRTPGR